MCDSMRLELDVGNTRLKWRLVVASGEVVSKGVSAVTASTDAFVGLGGLEYSQLQKVLISSVSSAEFNERLTNHWISKVGVGKVIVAAARPVMGGVDLAYKNVSALGIDRCLAMMAAYSGSPEGVCVIDCGSAMTIDYVSTGGSHEGGYILPGLALLKNGLLDGTANVAIPDILHKGVFPGRDTEECVGRGVNLMLRATIISAIAVARELSIESIVFTGGDAEFVLELCGVECECFPDLVFEGLGLYASELGLL